MKTFREMSLKEFKENRLLLEQILEIPVLGTILEMRG